MGQGTGERKQGERRIAACAAAERDRSENGRKKVGTDGEQTLSGSNIHGSVIQYALGERRIICAASCGAFACEKKKAAFKLPAPWRSPVVTPA
ncbi:hypothetical protein BSU04_07325 [Caballeronia sordidicola]|uniref:Uncharacterized protein n=1 Tax=Caballeronia sordidicola TaxID=196367 RepID=A0A226X7A6_CABSO|nr:hypothetical protein BSU04_07325 [Caballeronia sordidicola]